MSLATPLAGTRHLIEPIIDHRVWRMQEFLYYQEKLPEFEADEELSSLMCVCSLTPVAYACTRWLNFESIFCSHCRDRIDSPIHCVRGCRFGSRLIKQTYSVYVDTPTGRRKWHLGGFPMLLSYVPYCDLTDRRFPPLIAYRLLPSTNPHRSVSDWVDTRCARYPERVRPYCPTFVYPTRDTDDRPLAHT